MDITREFEVHSLIGNHKNPITNFNDIAMSRLSKDDIKRITDVLITREDTVDYFYYDLLWEPDI